MGITLSAALEQGATPVNPQQSAATNAYQSFIKANVPNAATPQTTPSPQAAQPGPVQKAAAGAVNYAKSVGNAVKSGVQNATKDLTDTTGGTSAEQAQGGFQAVGDVAKTVLSPLTEAISGIANALAGNKTVQAVANSPAGTAITKAGNAVTQNPIADKLTAWAQTHPQAAKDLGALGNIAALGTAGPTAEATPEIAGEAAGKVADVANTAAQKVSDALPGSNAETIAPQQSQQIAVRAIDNPLSATEQEQAASQGRTTIVNGKPVIAPSPRDLAMQEALKPLVENGQVTANVDKTTKLVNGDEQLRNIANTNQAITDQGKQIADGVGTHNKPYNPQDLNKALFNTEVPSSIKPTDEKVQNLQNAVFKIIQDNPKDTKGLLAARQQFDALVKKDYPNLYEQGMTPTKQYIGNLRETLNNFTAQQLPEGKLPNGVGFRDALMNQHQLINAREEMTQKFVREYPQGSSNFSRFLKGHPQARYLGRFLERRGLSTALQATGAAAAITAAVKAAKK